MACLCSNGGCQNQTTKENVENSYKDEYNQNLLKWDTYFYNICQEVSKNSSCLSRKIGSILIKDKRIISTGYNGPAPGIPHCDKRHLIDPDLRAVLETTGMSLENELEYCPRRYLGYKSGEGLQYCIALHSERNTLISAARMGIKTKKCSIAMSCGIPCKDCLTEIIGAGIKEIVCTDSSFYDSSSKYILNNSTLKVRIFSHLCNHETKINHKVNNFSLDINSSVCPNCGLFLMEK
jgi:dCMP deaminase